MTETQKAADALATFYENTDDAKALRAKANTIRALGRKNALTGGVLLFYASLMKHKAQRIERATA